MIEGMTNTRIKSYDETVIEIQWDQENSRHQNSESQRKKRGRTKKKESDETLMKEGDVDTEVLWIEN